MSLTKQTIDPPAWINQAKPVIEALSAEGAAPRFVGGCVRDSLIGRPIHDIDIATPDPPEKVIALLKQADLWAYPTGIAHGTITAIAHGQSFEVTTLRRDIENLGRHARVSFEHATWEDDAARRDFTINAMSLEPSGQLHDPFGGYADLIAGRVRFVGDPQCRIAEDRLRILRFFRFHAYFGRPNTVDEAALNACQKAAHTIPQLSAERIAVEIEKLIIAPNPLPVLRFMFHCQILLYALPEASSAGFALLTSLIAIEQSLKEDKALSSENDSHLSRRFLALINADDKHADQAVQRLKRSNAFKAKLLAIAQTIGYIHPHAHPKTMWRVLDRVGGDITAEAALLAWAMRKRSASPLDSCEQQAWLKRVKEARAFVASPCPLSGRHLQALGFMAGRSLGTMLDYIRDEWAISGFTLNQKQCLQTPKELMQAIQSLLSVLKALERAIELEKKATDETVFALHHKKPAGDKNIAKGTNNSASAPPNPIKEIASISRQLISQLDNHEQSIIKAMKPITHKKQHPIHANKGSPSSALPEKGDILRINEILSVDEIDKRDEIMKASNNFECQSQLPITMTIEELGTETLSLFVTLGELVTETLSLSAPVRNIPALLAAHKHLKTTHANNPLSFTFPDLDQAINVSKNLLSKFSDYVQALREQAKQANSAMRERLERLESAYVQALQEQANSAMRERLERLEPAALNLEDQARITHKPLSSALTSQLHETRQLLSQYERYERFISTVQERISLFY